MTKDSAGNLRRLSFENLVRHFVILAAVFAPLVWFIGPAMAALGDITTVAGGGIGDGGPAFLADLGFPGGVAADLPGNIYIADIDAHRVRKVDTAGVITTVAGNGLQGYSGDGGPAISASLFYPCGIAVDSMGNMYIADNGNNRIRKVDSAGVITTVAGNGSENYSGDGGPAISAGLLPTGVEIDNLGNLYIVDGYNQRIRKVDTTGVITTVAGNGTVGYSGDGGLATEASLNFPVGVALDFSGNMYIADHWIGIIRKVDTLGVITTVAGNDVAGHNSVKFGIFDRGIWYLDGDRSYQWDGEPSDTKGVCGAGLTNAIPIAGDWNGTGTSNIGVFANGYWYLDMNNNRQWDGEPADTIGVFGAGLTEAVPVAGDWNGTGTTKIGVFVNGYWYLDMNNNRQWDGEPTDKMAVFGVGLAGAAPVTGDWTGNGITKIGVYKDGIWYLDVNGNEVWDGEPADKTAVFGMGLTGEMPVTGDWNGDNITDIGIYQDGRWYLDMNNNGVWDGGPSDYLGVFGAGLGGAVAVPGKW